MYKNYRLESLSQVAFAKNAASKVSKLAADKSRNKTGTGSSQSGTQVRLASEESVKGTELGWREILASVAEMDLWEGTRRELRTEWRDYLAEAAALLQKPRDLMRVDTQSLPNLKNKVVVFVSSTFTDTKAERNTLMKDVFPYLRSLCRILGLDFDFVDMRWGVNEETTLNHATAAICINEIDRCISESAGPAFLAIISHKYGYRPIPSEIEQEEYTTLRTSLVESRKDVSLIDEYYRLDRNVIPPHYVLKPRTPEQQDWWEMNEKIQDLLQDAAGRCLSGDKLERYHISVTEQEIKEGILHNEHRDGQVIAMRRTLGDVHHPRHKHRHIIDIISGEINEEAQEFLSILKENKVPQAIGEDALVDVDYADPSMVEEYVRTSCDSICRALTNNILKNYEGKLHVEEDEVLDDILQHRELARDKCSLFIGREPLIGTVKAYIGNDSRRIFAVHGQSGCGKTALMAVCAVKARETLPDGVGILRFLGTTGATGSARNMLHNICHQITRAYGKDTSEVPTGYKELVVHFRECLRYATPSKPLTIFLDSLDQLSNEDFGKNLKWLSLRDELPPNCKLVVSTLPGHCLDVLEGFLPSQQFLEVKPLSVTDGFPILDKMLSAQNRTVTESQRKIVLDAFEKCPLPLYLRLAADVALRWHSYDTIDAGELPANMSGLITTLFQRLESRYGTHLVHHALAYLTVAKKGLSSTELEDILSCDDVVLNEVFSYWTPPHIRIPPLLWIRIRNELGAYLVERGADGTSTYGWYHRQFWETAEQRFVSASPDSAASFQSTARRAVADYFEGKYYDGKEFCDKHGKKTMQNRHIVSQPLVVTGDKKTGRLNKRKLSELSYQLLHLEDWQKFVELAGNLEFIEGKFVTRQGYECVEEFLEAAKASSDKRIMAISKFVGSNLSHLLREPDSVYQLASQQVAGSLVKSMFDELPPQILPRQVIVDHNPDCVEDPCEMTLRGHTSGIRSCVYSPNGEMIASTAEDGSLRVWDGFSGAEIVTVTGLSGPTYPGLADPYHGERPCAFSRDGLNVATGSEDSWIQVWDLAGAQIHSVQGHSDTITGIVYSPDNKTLATTSKDQTTKFWNMTKDSLTPIATVTMGLQGLACDYSPDGQVLAVTCYGGLVTIDTNSHIIRTKSTGFSSYNFGACYSPSGQEVASGGDNSSVTLWDADTGEAKSKLVGHKGWIWSIQYTKDGSKLLSCSSDRTLKVWDVLNHQCIVTVGGHIHRVSCVSVHPEQTSFVTGSLDFCLKIWNYNAVMSGNVPAVGSLHYNVLKVSNDQKYIVYSQGWSSSCSIDMINGQRVAETKQHGGFLSQISISPDSELMVSVDTGHGGQYTENAIYKAEVIVSSLPNGEFLSKLDVSGPAAVACRDDVIIVGTADGSVHVFDRNTYSEIHSWKFTNTGSPVGVISCQTSAGHVAIVADDLVKIWSLSSDSGNETFVTEIQNSGQPITKCLYSPDNVYLVTTDQTGKTKVWLVERDYSLVKSLMGHVSMMRDMAFSPSGRYFATVAVEMSLRIWDVSDKFNMICAWYGPVNQLGFIDENVLILGEATGNKRTVQFNDTT
ncbi:hypothetical protein LSH36_736g01022 [Paralvinella palmiformis]|uniref:Uncharacterized protein n=1 Tax=Paralvinella palmiformis TaxID=53620 RepID=A0AAD9J194_9ANNE|nr:hypothetical protein LSH36_736g01022 [Paralvinella palmiformis]